MVFSQSNTIMVLWSKGDETLGNYGNWLQELCKVVAYISGIELNMKKGKDKLKSLALVFHCLHF